MYNTHPYTSAIYVTHRRMCGRQRQSSRTWRKNSETLRRIWHVFSKRCVCVCMCLTHPCAYGPVWLWGGVCVVCICLCLCRHGLGRGCVSRVQRHVTKYSSRLSICRWQVLCAWDSHFSAHVRKRKRVHATDKTWTTSLEAQKNELVI